MATRCRTARGFRSAAVLLGLAIVVVAASVAGGVSLDQYILDQMKTSHAPGLAACIINRDHVMWARGYGWAQIEAGIPASPDTLFKLASVSKLVTATALMQLRDEQLFTLDDNVDDYLHFPVRNPNEPNARITFRQVLTHTGSIRDNWSVMNALLTRGDPKVPLREFVEQYFTPGGKYYDANQNFYVGPPGTEWHYANLGFALAGYLVEARSGVPFETYCQQRLFAPLKMTESSWYLANLDPNHLAMAYYYESRTSKYVPYGFLSYPDVPAGELHTSVLQLANFLIAHLNGGRFGTESILEPNTVAEMHTVQYPPLAPDQGLGFYYTYCGGDRLLGHDGGDWGFSTACFLRPGDGAGAIVLVNGDGSGVCRTVLARLFDEASVVLSRPLGDLNCDGRLSFADINPFVLALSDPGAYREAFDGDPYPLCDLMLGDANHDGTVDLGDINPFVKLLGQAGAF